MNLLGLVILEGQWGMHMLQRMSPLLQIVLQKSQNAVRLNFRQRTKQAVIVDRCRFKRATEVVSEFVTE